MSACPVCEARVANLGEPSTARWIGPDGNEYCSLHFIQAFGHGERMVKIEDYEPPATRKAPAPKAEKKPRAKKVEEVDA